VKARMGHEDFLSALRSLVEAYAILGRAITGALPPQFSAVDFDPLTRVTLEQFGDPFVRWFRHGSGFRGVCVSDGTLVFDEGPIVAVHFIPGLAAEDDSELPAGWREEAQVVALFKNGVLALS